MVANRGKRPSRTSNRPVLRTKKPCKSKGLSANDATLQKKISKEGLMKKKGRVPKGNIALQKQETKSFQKKTKPFKKKEFKRRQSKPEGDSPGIIFLARLPHGFYEKQLMRYFIQFGDVTNVKVVRSKETGKGCGYGYVQFRSFDVAKIAAQSMNNYLTYGKIIKCRYIRYSKRFSNKIFGGMPFRENNCPKVVNRTEAVWTLNNDRNRMQDVNRRKRIVNTLNKKLKTLQSLGVQLDINLDVGGRKLTRSTVVASTGNGNSIPSDSGIPSDETPSSPAAKVTRNSTLHSKLKNSIKKGSARNVKNIPSETCKLIKETKIPLKETPKCGRNVHLNARTKKDDSKKRRKPVVGTEENNAAKKKRLSL